MSASGELLLAAIITAVIVYVLNEDKSQPRWILIPTLVVFPLMLLGMNGPISTAIQALIEPVMGYLLLAGFGGLIAYAIVHKLWGRTLR